jgi:hypothetical protein
MKTCWIFLILAACAFADETSDRDAVRSLIARFNDQHERPATLAKDSDIAPLDRFSGQEVSQVYFEPGAVKFITPEVAFVDAAANQYGSLIGKRSMPAYFVVKREAGGWRVAVMRVGAR